MTHVKCCQGSLDKVGLFIRDPGWRSRLVCFQGVQKFYTMALVMVILMEMLEMEVVMLMVV